MASRNPREASRKPKEPPGTPRREGEYAILDSPSINVALREVGFMFFYFFGWFSFTPVSDTPVTGALKNCGYRAKLK
jgi:hypothetical protein